MAATRPTRAEVPIQETWNLDDLFPSEAAFAAALAEVETAIPTVTTYQGLLGDGAGLLAACLVAQEQVMMQFVPVNAYAYLRESEDGADPINQARASQVSALLTKLNAAFSFIRSEILALPPETIHGYLAVEPDLEPFEPLLAKLQDARPYQLTAETERALASLGEVLGAPSVVYERAKSSDMRFPTITERDGSTVEAGFAAYEGHYELSPDTELRRAAFDAFSHGLERYKNTFAATFATEIKKNVALAKLRGFASAEAMLLQPQQVSPEMYTNILDIIQTELAPHMRRYANLRRRVLGLSELRYCDIKAPLDPAYNPPVSFAEASGLITDGLAILGDEYQAILQRAFRERWIDLPDNEGKSTGAFCHSPYGVHPFILITWQNTMRDVFVLAHELGHAGHFALAMQYQRYTNLRPSLACIEAPSTMNELLLGQHILQGTSDVRMRRWVIMQLLATYHHNFVTHLLEGELQRRIYRLAEGGRPITAATLSATKGEILTQFWGDAVRIDDAARLTWMRQPHYYMGLYPYTYAAGLTVATAAAQAIAEEGAPAVQRWLQVLKAGGTLQPLELFQLAGVDMSSPEPIRRAVAYVGTLVDELERSF